MCVSVNARRHLPNMLLASSSEVSFSCLLTNNSWHYISKNLFFIMLHKHWKNNVCTYCKCLITALLEIGAKHSVKTCLCTHMYIPGLAADISGNKLFFDQYEVFFFFYKCNFTTAVSWSCNCVYVDAHAVLFVWIV